MASKLITRNQRERRVVDAILRKMWPRSWGPFGWITTGRKEWNREAVARATQ